MAPPVNSTEKHLFPAGMQKGREYVEVFSSSGSDPTSWWHVNQNQRSKISRHYSPELRSYYVSIGANCALPRSPQTLHLLQSQLVFQIMVPGISQGFRANIMYVAPSSCPDLSLSLSLTLHVDTSTTRRTDAHDCRRRHDHQHPTNTP